MVSPQAADSPVVTFYSYKGGVGRSMALANVAVLLARDFGKDVIVVDWDLEAPGLHKFFGLNDEDIQDGVIDYLYRCKERMTDPARPLQAGDFGLEELLLDVWPPKDVKPSKRADGGRVRLLGVGNLANRSEYAKRVNDFGWSSFYKEWNGAQVMEMMRFQLKTADIVLIDSRTGITEVGGVCTVQLPDIVVFVFVFNDQNIRGLEQVAQNLAGDAPSQVFDQLGRRPRILLLPSRKDVAEIDRLGFWELEAAKRLGPYVENQLVNDQYKDALTYVQKSAVPYVPYFAYGEEVAVETRRGLEVVEAYKLLVEILRQELRPRVVRSALAIALTDRSVPPPSGSRLDRFERIGIVLAGGGARGAYQAGAMGAIHDFLKQNNALDKVRTITGTSIGSWNAMFWLAGLVGGEDSNSVHRRWWRSISLGRLAEFRTLWPFRRNHFLRPTPWREAFGEIFVRQVEARDRLRKLFVSPESQADPPIHFYFTRSNVERGILEFSTNWPGVVQLTRPRLRTTRPDDREPVVPPDQYEVIMGEDITEVLTRTERAVFASMDLPPLFPYSEIKLDMTEWFEDGAALDPVPLWPSVQLENCDLVFVLPLHASVAELVNHASVLRRLHRAVDVRQGMLERSALKNATLYNELAALRNRVDSFQEWANESSPSDPHRVQSRAMRRVHRPLSVFAIAPSTPLALGNNDLWKGREAGAAFELMYAATRHELAENFEQDTDPNWIKLTLVSPRGERSYTDEF